jgi:hypothetical protein
VACLLTIWLPIMMPPPNVGLERARFVEAPQSMILSLHCGYHFSESRTFDKGLIEREDDAAQ